MWMQKDFDGWNDEKKRVSGYERPKLYTEREIWWCSLGVNVGFEQDGAGADYQRPVVILKGVSRNTCYVVPLTTSPKRHRYRIPIGRVDGREAVALLSQIRVIDTRRLVNKLGFLDKGIFQKIRKTVKDLL